MEGTCRKEPRFSTGQILATVGALLTLALVGIGIALWWLFTAFMGTVAQFVTFAAQEAVAPAIVVLDLDGNLCAGNIEAAYVLTTKEFRERVSREAFEALMDDRWELRSQWSDFVLDEHTDNSCVYKVTATAENGRTATVRLRLRRTDTEWRVDDIVLP